jgi:hypothetical protein
MSRFGGFGGGSMICTGELVGAIGDLFSDAESSISIPIEPRDPDIRVRGATGLLANAPASSESANSQARLSSSTTSRSSVLGIISLSEASLFGETPPENGPGATMTSDGSTDGDLGREGEGRRSAGTFPEEGPGVEYR